MCHTYCVKNNHRNELCQTVHADELDNAERGDQGGPTLSLAREVEKKSLFS